MKPINFLFFLILMVLLLLSSCDGGSSTDHNLEQGDTIAIKYATHLTMVDYGDYIKADFRNPWDTTRTLQTFILAPRDKDLPENLPKGKVVRTPIQKAIIYTSTHNSLFEELGAIDAIKGICDTEYIRNEKLRDRVERGVIEDCGSSMAPNIEKILMLQPDVIMLSAFENSNDHNKVGQIGIPIIDCTDYMETSPLARAEWMKFFGRLCGKGEVADSLFNHIEESYNNIRLSLKDVSYRPSVFFDLIYGQYWTVPAAYSTTGVLIEDAGGKNPFDTYKRSGGAQLAPEEVLFKAKDADLWLIKCSQTLPLTKEQLAKDNPLYSKFQAFQTGNIYVCDTDNSSYFEDIPFHPHWILAEYAYLLHPELGKCEDNHHYYSKITQ